MLVRWLVFIHVLSAITFFLAHGASAAVIYKLRSETNFTRIQAILDLSLSTFKAYMLSFLIMGLTGLALPFMIHIWNKGWIWLSIVLLVVVVVWMGLLTEKHTKPLRRMVGLPYMIRGTRFEAEPPASEAEVQAAIQQINPTQWLIGGYIIPVIILWLMIFKPF